MSAHNPDDEEAALFRAALVGVEPIPTPNRVDLKPTPRRAHLNNSASTATVTDILSDRDDASPPNEYLSNGLSRMTLRKLRRNFWTIHATLDLHGLTSDQARVTLQAFLLQAQQQNGRCVLVIHGKGMNSASGEAILKTRTRNWLMQLSGVLAYCDATLELGGSGAVLILLRSVATEPS